MSNETVVILGASNKPDRYAYKAFKMLQEYGHVIIPVNPALDEIESVPVVHSLDQIKQEIVTVTLYMRPERYLSLVPSIVALKPKRVIFNPGTESQEVSDEFARAGIECINGCTLVMLRTGLF